MCCGPAYPGDVPHVEEVVYLGWCRQETCYYGIIHLYGSLSHDVTNGFDFLLKVCKLLVDHASKDTLDL